MHAAIASVGDLPSVDSVNQHPDHNDFDLDALFARFRRPLDDDPVFSAAPESVRDWLSRFLWRTLILRPSLEGVVLDQLTKVCLRPDQLERLRRCYRERMRSQLSRHEISEIRRIVLTIGATDVVLRR